MEGGYSEPLAAVGVCTPSSVFIVNDTVSGEIVYSHGRISTEESRGNPPLPCFPFLPLEVGP